MYRILLVISEAPPITSGVARVAANLKQGLRSLGHQVDIISLDDVPRFVHGELRLSSMVWKGVRKLLPRLDSYDIVHVHGPVPTFSDVALLWSAIGRGPNGPLLVYTHLCEIDLRGLRLPCDLYNWTHKQLARLADQVLVSTPGYAVDLGRYIPAERIAIVPWGVDDDWYDAHIPKADTFSVLFVGQLRPYKGLDTLIKAMARVSGAHLEIIGGGPLEQQFRKLAKEYNLDSVTFRGRVSDADLIDAYARSHVIVLPSTTRAEAFGIVVLEGMLAGCVPIVSQLPGVVDIVDGAGMTFPVGDDAALARLLVQVRDNDALRNGLSQQARARARQFSWQRTVYWHDATYRRLDALRRFSMSLDGGKREDSALDVLLRDSIATLDATSGSIMLLDSAARYLQIHAASGLQPSAEPFARQPIDRSIAGFVASTSTPLILPQGLPAELSRIPNVLHRTHIHSSLSVPILDRGDTLGVMNLSSHRADRRFGEDDLQWLISLAVRAGRTLKASSKERGEKAVPSVARNV
jgi:glycosyltransferase involved in cell wall biosynthesis